MAKEAYVDGKKGLKATAKRPMHTAKEAYSYGERGLTAIAYLSAAKDPTMCARSACVTSTSKLLGYADVSEAKKRQSVCGKRGLLILLHAGLLCMHAS